MQAVLQPSVRVASAEAQLPSSPARRVCFPGALGRREPHVPAAPAGEPDLGAGHAGRTRGGDTQPNPEPNPNPNPNANPNITLTLTLTLPQPHPSPSPRLNPNPNRNHNRYAGRCGDRHLGGVPGRRRARVQGAGDEQRHLGDGHPRCAAYACVCRDNCGGQFVSRSIWGMVWAGVSCCREQWLELG